MDNNENIYETDTKNAPLDAIYLYFKQIGNYPLLTPEEEVELITAAQNGDNKAREKVINSNLRLVVSIAKKYHKNAGMSFLDIVQEGNIGLMKCIDKYDPSAGYRFSTYATWWIRQAISKAIINKSNTIRMPAHMFDLSSKINKASQKLLNDLGREPTDDEIAQELEIKVEKIKDILNISKSPMSLDYTVGEDDDTSIGELIADDRIESPEAIVINKEKHNEIMKVLNTLNEREREVIILRFGIEDGQNKSLEEVGKICGVTKERIRQIEIKALRKLRHPFRQSILQEYLN